MVLSTAPLGLLLLAGLCLSQHFSYDGEHGPENWSQDYEQCGGKRQSPIDIVESDAKNVSLPELRLLCGKKKVEMTITNNGHTIMLKPKEANQAMVTGGPLGDKVYVFEQLHFHWGKTDNEGSETLINGKSYSSEMHAVFYNAEYETFSKAQNYTDGLTVIGYMYNTRKWNNPAFDPIVAALPDVQEAGTEVSLRKPYDLLALLRSESLKNQRYYTYEGSLTTPPCLEIVTWIVLKDPQYLSYKQMDAFRKIQDSDGKPMTHNFRPVQPLGDREVLQNIPSKQDSGQCGNKKPLSFNVLQTVLGLFLFAV